MPQPTRVRFAPSPTGYLHIGNLRSAIFSYLYARHTGGSFILRIEDTDRLRLVDDSLDYINQTLVWMDIQPDEGPDTKNQDYGPYIQSQRLDEFRKYANQLVEAGRAYKDYTSPEELEKLRAEAVANKTPFKFKKKMARLKPNRPDEKHVVRFEITEGPDVEWDDLVWGHQSWSRDVLDDFIAVKSDGFPTYNFAVVIDDYLMKISHVFRGSEFIATTPKNLLVYDALGWGPPEFAHLPQVLGPDKAKLSKRHGAKSALEYREQGYLPEALFNFLASLGFNDGTTQEIYSRDELIKAFEPARIQSSPAVFDTDKLDWMNGMYIRNLPIDELADRCEPFWPKTANDSGPNHKLSILKLVQDRLKFLAELAELTEFFFVDPKISVTELKKTLGDKYQESSIKDVIAAVEDSDFSHSNLEKRLRALTTEKQLKTGQLFAQIRLIITGKTAAPGLFETMEVLGKETTMRRLKKAIID